jgi:cytochrome P450
MLVSNGPEHARFRRLVTRAFTPRAVEALGERVEEIAADLLDDLAARRDPEGVVDVVADYADLLPHLVIAEVLGVPADMRDTFLSWTGPMVPLTDLGTGYLTFRRAEETVRRLNGWFAGHLARLRREPGDDLLSEIVRRADEDAAAGGPGFSETDLVVTAGLLLAAASETTVSLIGNAVVVLLDHPDQLASLTAEPAGWPGAVEEVLRFDPPSHITYRHSLSDVTVHGVTIERGKLLMPIFAGANRDPAVFSDPATFDITRENASQHLSFSAGAHYCFGAPLARLETRVALRRFFERFPAARLAERPRRRPTRAMRGYAAIPVQLGPAAS